MTYFDGVSERPLPSCLQCGFDRLDDTGLVADWHAQAYGLTKRPRLLQLPSMPQAGLTVVRVVRRFEEEISRHISFL